MTNNLPSMKTIKISKFARLANVSVQAVYKAIKASQIITELNGEIDPNKYEWYINYHNNIKK